MKKHTPTKEEKRFLHQVKIADLAEKHLDAAIARGEPFTEGLSNWAVNKAIQEIGKP